MLKVKRLKNTSALKTYEKMKANGGYCPCKLNRDETTKCICKEFRDQMANLSDKQTSVVCHCGVYEANKI